jgi:rhamnosyltransferase
MEKDAAMMMSRSFAVGVVAFNAGASLSHRLDIAVSQNRRVFVYDNSPENPDIRYYCRRKGNEGITYLTCGKNIGLGYAMSAICAQSYYEDYKSLLFFDQDTVFTENTLSYVEEFIKNNPCIVEEYSTIQFASDEAGKTDAGTSGYDFRDVRLTINSGSLFFLENAKRIGWHSTKYFVDCVDYEFCLNSDNHRLKIGKCGKAPGLDHGTEQGDSVLVVFGKKRRLRKYSSKRIRDAVSSSIRLMLRAAFQGNPRYAFLIGKSLIGYVFWQIAVRMIAS